jgi:hypothetical protein
MDIDELKGRTLLGLDRGAAPTNWIFRFGPECWLGLGCWRVVKDGRIGVAGGDHGQLFGLREPVDAVDRVQALIGGSVVVRATLAPETADLRVEFDNGGRLETFTDSSGYESATIHLEKYRQIIVMGGGSIAEF